MRKLLAAAAIAASFLIPAATTFAFDATDVSGSTGLTTTGKNAYGETYVAAKENTNIATWVGARLIAPAFSIVGVLFFALTVYAGFLWMTAQGDPKQVAKAKDILKNATIGLIITVSAYAISSEVIQQIIGSVARV